MAYRLLTPRFELGRTVATAGAVALGVDLIPFLRKHHCGEWGDLSDDDKRANEDAISTDLRILSKYHVKDESGRAHPIYIITEHDRSSANVELHIS